MEFSGVAVQEQTAEPGGPAACCVAGDEGGVCVSRCEVGGLSLSKLDDRIEYLGKARAKIEGLLAEVLAERAGRSSNREASGVLRARVLESAGRASSDVKTAVSLSNDFPSTLEALVSGEINSGHARVIERVAGKPNYHGEETVLGSARGVPSDLLSRYALRWAPTEERDPTKYQQQHEDRRAAITQEPDGSWKLFAHLDYMAGRRVSMAWAKMAETFRREERPTSKTTYVQRNADALVQLITRDGPQRAAPASLLMIADYDAGTDTLSPPRLDDGQPVPPELLEGLLDRAEVYTALVDAQGQPLWLGRSRRTASLAQRLMLAARDQGCIGCIAPSERCEAHHIKHWAAGGETNLDNLVQLCPGCHHLVHECDWQIKQNPKGRYRIEVLSEDVVDDPHVAAPKGRHCIEVPPKACPDNKTTAHYLTQHNPVLRN